MVVPNATMEVLRQLTGDGASKQSLRIEKYVATSGRKTPEVADLLINTSASYEGLVRESKEILESIDPYTVLPQVIKTAFLNEVSSEALAKEVSSKTLGTKPKDVDVESVCENLREFSKIRESSSDALTRNVFRRYLLEQITIAKKELLESFGQTLNVGAGNNDGYTHSEDREGGPTYESFGHGVKVHLDTGDIHVQGMEVSRSVITDGVYKLVRSKSKTLAKNELRQRLPLHKWRQFVLRCGKFKSVTIRGQRFIPRDFSPIAE